MRSCQNCQMFLSDVFINEFCSMECLFENKIKIKKEDLPKHRSGISPTKVFKNKKKYSRKSKNKEKVYE